MNFGKYKDGKDLLKKTGLSIDAALELLKAELRERGET